MEAGATADPPPKAFITVELTADRNYFSFRDLACGKGDVAGRLAPEFVIAARSSRALGGVGSSKAGCPPALGYEDDEDDGDHEDLGDPAPRDSSHGFVAIHHGGKDASEREAAPAALPPVPVAFESAGGVAKEAPTAKLEPNASNPPARCPAKKAKTAAAGRATAPASKGSGQTLAAAWDASSPAPAQATGPERAPLPSRPTPFPCPLPAQPPAGAVAGQVQPALCADTCPVRSQVNAVVHHNPANQLPSPMAGASVLVQPPVPACLTCPSTAPQDGANVSARAVAHALPLPRPDDGGHSRGARQPDPGAQGSGGRALSAPGAASPERTPASGAPGDRANGSKASPAPKGRKRPPQRTKPRTSAVGPAKKARAARPQATTAAGGAPATAAAVTIKCEVAVVDDSSTNDEDQGQKAPAPAAIPSPAMPCR